MLKDINYEKFYVVSDTDLSCILFHGKNLEEAKQHREACKILFPDRQIVIFERNDLHNWEGKFYAKEGVM
jgi:hypothetical protein